MLKTIFHLFAALHFIFGCYYDYTYVRIPSTSTLSTPFGGKLKYLTFIDAMLQALYFSVAFANDLFGSNETNTESKPLIRRFKDILFTSLAFPIGVFVTLSFWSIWFVDRELVLPRSLDPYFPLWLNHLMHTNTAVFMITELITSFRMYPKRKQGMTILTTFILLYVTWVHIIYSQTGKWVYPVLKVLNLPSRLLFFALGGLISCGLYTVGEKINKSFWSDLVEHTAKSKKKKAK